MENLSIKPQTKKYIQYILYFLIVASLIVSTFLVVNYLLHKATVIKIAQEKAIKITHQANVDITQKINVLKQQIEQLSQQLSAENLSPIELETIIKKKPATMHGLGVYFIPQEKKVSPLPSLYLVNINGQEKLTTIQKNIDRNNPEYQRYSIPLKQGAGFLEPFLDSISKEIVIEYAAPFYHADHTIKGVVFGNYSREFVQTIVASAFPSNVGYGEIVTKTGGFISHPNAEYIGQAKTGVQLAREAGNIDVAVKIENALSGKTPLFEENTNWISAEKSWNVFEPMPKVPWLVVGVFIIDEMVTCSTLLHREFLNALFAVIMCCLFILFLYIKIYMFNPFGLALGSLSISLSFVLAIIFIWNKAYTEVNVPLDKPIEKNSFFQKLNVQNSPSVDAENKLLRTKEHTTEKPTTITIPTGIYLYQLTIENETVSFSGYVWQKYPAQTTIKEGVFFPQATKATIDKIYSFVENDIKTIGYSVRCTIINDFNLQYYPFDSQKIKLQLWPRSLDNNVILIPDFDGYKIFNSHALPGLNTRMIIQGWHLDQSYFILAKEKFLTNFGYHAAGSYNLANNGDLEENTQRNRPQLSYTIIVDRYFHSSLILILLPIFIILVLLFIVLILIQHSTFSQILASIASLFFTCLIAYTAFRSTFVVQQIVFFDYIYFIVQTLILLTAILTITYYKKFKIHWLHAHYLFVPKLLFWPFTTLSIFVVSIIFLY